MYDFGLAPPHIFFNHSPWRYLFESLCESYGYDGYVLNRKGKEVSIRKGKKEPFITLQGSEEFLTHIQEIFERPIESEENSIKFSALDDNEIERYRKGRPSRKLKFELSRLSDLAQYLALIEQMQGFKSTFSPSSSGGQIKLSKSIAIEYVSPTKREAEALGLLMQEHIYSFHGFDQKTDGAKFQVGDKRVLVKDPKQIALLLDLTRHALPSRVEKMQVSPQLIPLHASIKISADALVIDPYRNSIGDLQQNTSWYGRWITSEMYGLFPVEYTPFYPNKCTVPRKEISSFVSQYPHFLSRHPGFKVHHTSKEEAVSYTVEPSGALRFVSKTRLQSKIDVPHIDFGAYTWVKGAGFYPKEGLKGQSDLQTDSSILPYQVADYIRSHKSALEQLPGFFTDDSPLVKSGLKIYLDTPDIVSIEPLILWKSGIHSDDVRIYDEYGYLDKTGFFLIPDGQMLFAQERNIEAANPEEWDHFFASGLHQLSTEVLCEIDPQLCPPKSLTLLASDIEEKNLKERGSAALWQMNLSWESELGRVSLDEVVEGKAKGIRYLPTEAGLLDLSQDRFAWIESKKKMKKKEKVQKDLALELSSLDLIRLHAHDTITFDSDSCAHGPVELIERLLEMKSPEPPDRHLLNCQLRPYQEHGLYWLWYLYTSRLSGLLCDDMGVGKTHQAMALLASVKALADRDGKKIRFLIICPTSLVWHWKEKLHQFVPSLDVCAYFGSTRSDSSLKDADVLLTTYGIWRNERKNLQKLEFDVAIFDELQIAKNHSSLIWSALSDVKSRMRLGLTGTPIENQLRELKALFDLILPGYMPEEHAFRELFARPIERGYLEGRKELLSRYVKPFILRRRKQDVLQDLPQKSEEICHAELIGDQKSLYRSVAATHSASLLSALKDNATHVPYMHIFALLSALKQISNHPATYLKDVINFEKYESGKWSVFVELLEEAQESGLKVVVFSQYLSMLDIMAKYLDSKGIGYAQVRGQTKKRGAEISRFQTDPSCKVFLGSLQAAGLGIDLTAGSIVIHYDRWWNAARENQATDRVHRIGQERGVQVYKLVTLNSIEERIDLMIESKASLLEDVVSWDDHQIVKKLSRNELIELLEGLQER